jgi:hypothetical protein
MCALEEAHVELVLPVEMTLQLVSGETILHALDVEIVKMKLVVMRGLF